MKEKARKVAYVLVAVVLLAVVVFCGYKMYTSRIEEEEAQSAYEELALKVGGVVEETQPVAETEEEITAETMIEETEVEEKHYPEMNLDMAALKEINPDFRGWLYFPLLNISYPVVQGEDNDYYLERTFEGEDSHSGCIFMDCGASGDWSDRNTFLFGHNMKDGSMFGTFKTLLEDTTICDENPYFYIYTEDKVYTYEIFSYYITKSTSDRYMTFTSDGSYDAYVNWAKENSEYVSIADLSERKNIVSMSTCYGSVGTTRRLLLHGVLVAEEDF